MDRAAAAFLGFAIGDALGATAEFMSSGEIKAQFGVLKDICGGGWLHLPVGAVTDDTEMSLCIARSIHARGFDPGDIAVRFAVWLKTRPRDVGGTCRRGIRRFIVDGTLCAPPSDMDAGNGAAMRMTPIAIATVGNTNLLVDWALRQAHITHHHPLSDAAGVLFGQMVHLALVGHGKQRLEELVRTCIAMYPVFAYDNAEVFGGAYVVDTVRTVLRAFFATSTFEECVVTTVNCGGDTDTAGAIAGSIAGAYYGLEEIPDRWTRKLESSVRHEVQAVARSLVLRSPAVRDPDRIDIARTFVGDWQKR